MADIIGYPRESRRPPAWTQTFPCGNTVQTPEGTGKAAHQEAVDEHRDGCATCQLYMTKSAPNRGPDQSRKSATGVVT